jgi:hypothetical protein
VEDIGLLGWNWPLIDKYIIFIFFIALHVLVRGRMPTVYSAYARRHSILSPSSPRSRFPSSIPVTCGASSRACRALPAESSRPWSGVQQSSRRA